MYRLARDFAEAPADVWFNTTDDQGVSLVADAVDLDSIEFITPFDQVGGRDGALSGPPSVAPRAVTVRGLVVAPTAELADLKVAAVKAVLLPSGRNSPRDPVVWDWHHFGAGRRLALLVRPVGTFRVLPLLGRREGGEARVIEFGITAANPPWKLASGQAEGDEIGLADPAQRTGRTYDLTYDYNYGLGTPTGGTLVVVNSGDRDALPLFTITGPADFPLVQNVTTGGQFLVEAVLGAGDVVTVDSQTGRITPGSVRISGRPFTLAPGSNTIQWRTLTESYYPAARLRVAWRSTYA